MAKKKHPSEETDLLFRYIRAIDKHIEMGMLSIDIIHSFVVVDNYLHLYYSRPHKYDPDKMYKGFCQMLRLWINHQRSIKKGDLLQMVENGEFDHITKKELEDRNKLSHFLFHPLSSTDDIEPPTDSSTESLRKYHERYIHQTYSLLSENDPIQVVAIDSKGKPFVVIHEKGSPSQLIRQKPANILFK